MRSISRYSLSGAIFALLFAMPALASAANITVTINDNYFSGKVIDINPGDTVTWRNAGAMQHTVTADNNSFDSGALQPGQSYSQTFSQAGNYPYYCKFHGAAGGTGMSGLIRVTAQGATQPVYTPTPTVTQPVQTVTQPAVTIPNPYAPAGSTNVLSQAQSLLAQVVALQQVLAGLRGTAAPSGNVVPSTTAPSAMCPQISRSLKPGMSGDDVTRLQQYLAGNTSIYPEGSVTGYYGSLTQAAVQRWQIKYNIVSSGDPASTGFGMVGPRTAAAIALQCSSATTPTVPTTPTTPTVDPNQPTYGGFIQVTPVTGDAPLDVSVQATVNTVNSCQSAIYMLDWGDGTNKQPIPVSANTCQQVQQNYTHNYPYGGAYVVALTAGDHKSTATIFVNGPVKGATTTPATTTPPVAPQITVTAPSGGANMQTGDQIQITWQSNEGIPAGSTIGVDLYTGSGQKVVPSDMIAITSYLSGTIPWTIPLGPGAQTCPSVYPSGLCGATLPTGSYKIHVSAHKPATSGNMFGDTIAQADSGIFTIIATATSTPANLPAESFNANVTTGTAPLKVTFAGTVTSNDAGYCQGGCFDLLRYGDGDADFVALPTSAPASQTYTMSHTYQNAGSYTATLYQGLSAGTATVGHPITISVAGQVTSNYTYGPLYVAPSQSAAHSATATFDLPTACTAFQLSWGDGSSDIVQTQGSGCAQTPVSRNFTHQYSSPGSYDINLLRGASLQKQDSAGIVIS